LTLGVNFNSLFANEHPAVCGISANQIEIVALDDPLQDPAMLTSAMQGTFTPQGRLIVLIIQTQKEASRLQTVVRNNGFFSDGLSGDQKFKDRRTALNRFTARKVRILITRVIAIHGLDFVHICIFICTFVPEDRYFMRLHQSAVILVAKTQREIDDLSQKLKIDISILSHTPRDSLWLVNKFAILSLHSILSSNCSQF
jgi:hypothetical protein